MNHATTIKAIGHRQLMMVAVVVWLAWSASPIFSTDHDDDGRPPESFPYGSPDLRRLRAGRYRVFYTIDEERRVIQVDHVARLP
jgi:ParE toxin of type II toxin-antitoxin system, parDE